MPHERDREREHLEPEALGEAVGLHGGHAAERRLEELVEPSIEVNGRFRSPPIAASSASTIIGNTMIPGASCGGWPLGDGDRVAVGDGGRRVAVGVRLVGVGIGRGHVVVGAARHDRQRRRRSASATVSGPSVVGPEALVAVEGQPDEAGHVDRGEDRGDDPDRPRARSPRARNAWLMISSLEKKPESGGTPAIASHATTIANAVYGMYLRKPPITRMSCTSWLPWITEPGAEEEAALVERVAQHHEHRGGVRADADREEHVAELADRGVREHALDVGLEDRDRAREQRGDRRPPTTTTVPASLTSRNGCARQSRNTPAVTIVAAWISAETGVGPSMASGSHRCSGICALLPHAGEQEQQGDGGGGARRHELRAGARPPSS